MTAALNLRHAIGEMRAIALVEALLRALAQRQAFDHRTDTRFGVVGALQVARLERVGLAGIGEHLREPHIHRVLVGVVDLVRAAVQAVAADRRACGAGRYVCGARDRGERDIIDLLPSDVHAAQSLQRTHKQSMSTANTYTDFARDTQLHALIRLFSPGFHVESMSR